MAASDPMSAAPALVVLVGPQASGTSTIAAALADDLRGAGEQLALVALDAIAAMALPTLPDWSAVSGIFETVTARWLQAGCSCVIAEGAGSATESGRLREQAGPGVAVVVVAVTASFETAYARASADATRGISRRFDFLQDVYARWPDELRRVGADLVLDTEESTVEASVAAVRAALAVARQTVARG